MRHDSLMPLYQAGEVRRFHTMRVLHPQSVGEHSWGVALMLLWLHDDKLPSAQLMRAAIAHDLPEAWTGDIPAPAKWASKDLTDALHDMEKRFELKHGMNGHTLTAEEQDLMSFADMADLVLYCVTEISMGNWRMRNLFGRGMNVLSHMIKHKHLLPRAASFYNRLLEVERTETWGNFTDER
jgi:5'-deoxynucleotidase YfbR-like HD superfamily hydrolase